MTYIQRIRSVRRKPYTDKKMELILLMNLPDGEGFSLQMDERTEGSPGFVSDSERSEEDALRAMGPGRKTTLQSRFLSEY